MNDFYCAAPWRGLHVNPRGDVKTCCAGDPNMLGNLNQHTIEQILHGPVLQEIRQTIRRGRPHAYCYNCVQAERYGRSERDWHNNLNPDFDPKKVNDSEHFPVLVDVRWNTTCNLSCNYCAEACSSRWASLKGLSVKSGARPYYEQVCQYLEAHQDKIKEVALVGGEPLLLPENVRLLDVVPKQAIVTLITNASVDFENNKIVQALSLRQQVGWSISFDNIDQRFEYVRHGSSWQSLETNLGTIKNFMTTLGHWGGIHAVYNIYNATRLVEFTQFARDHDFTIHWQSLYQPRYLDPSNLGQPTVDLARAEIETLLASDLCRPNEKTFFENVLGNLVVGENLCAEFKQHIEKIETVYHQDQHGKFNALWPEINYLCS